MGNETVTLSLKDYLQMLRMAAMLEALEAAGVDNWEGYYEATRKFYKDEEQE